MFVELDVAFTTEILPSALTINLWFADWSALASTATTVEGLYPVVTVPIPTVALEPTLVIVSLQNICTCSPLVLITPVFLNVLSCLHPLTLI